MSNRVYFVIDSDGDAFHFADADKFHAYCKSHEGVQTFVGSPVEVEFVPAHVKIKGGEEPVTTSGKRGPAPRDPEGRPLRKDGQPYQRKGATVATTASPTTTNGTAVA